MVFGELKPYLVLAACVVFTAQLAKPSANKEGPTHHVAKFVQ